MIQQDQFEADYLAAFHARPSMGQWLRKLSDGKYADTQTNNNFKVWLQQAKRREEQIAELRRALYAYATHGTTLESCPAENHGECTCGLDAVFAKYEVKS